MLSLVDEYNHNTTIMVSESLDQQKPPTRRSGVADYFTILGVGEKLVWKHAQKKSEDIQEEENDAALLERFYREIVDVSILTTLSDDGESSHANNNHNSHGPAQPIVTVSSYTDESTAKQQYINVTIAPSPSDVTSVVTGTGTGTDSRAEYQYHGLTLIQQTRPAGWASPQQLWAKSQVLDANLDPLHGLSGEIQTLQLEMERLKQKVNTPLKDLRRKVESTLRLRRSDHVRAHGPKCYLGFRRRAPDESDRPAIANVQLMYVKLHNATLLEVSPETKSNSPPSLQRAIMGRVNKAGNLVRDRVVGHPDTNTSLNTSSMLDLSESEHVLLEDMIPAPTTFDEWSIPDHYKYLKLPSDRPDSPVKTMLFPDDATTASGSSGAGVGVEAAIMEQRKRDHVNWQEMIKPRVIRQIPKEMDEEYTYIPILAVRRQRTGDDERYHEDAAIVDLSITFSDGKGPVMPDETIYDFDEMVAEEEGSLLSKSEWMATEIRPQDDRGHRPRLGSMALLVKRNIPLGFCDAAFCTRVLDRFPHKNYKGLPLPEEELPMFCYPTGCRLHRARFSDAPLAQYYGFVVKNERGDSIYVSCVSFMEPLTKQKKDQLTTMSEKRRRVSLPHKRFWDRRLRQHRNEGASSVTSELMNNSEFSDDSHFLLTGFDEMTTFENKTICLVSRNPFWTAFRRFLSHLHVLAGSSSDLPLERCISHLLLTVPIPKPGGPSILIPLPTLNAPMVLALPPMKDLPLVDLPFERLVACLDVPTIVTVVLGFLALERKVIVMSTRPSLVSDVCELLRSLLFPFDLCAPYVPRLTEPFMSCLEFPGAIFVGIHDDGTADGLAAVVRKSMPEDSTIVDLDSGSVDCSGDRMTVLNSSWGVIPPGPRSVLVSEIETLCRDAGIAPGQEPLDSQIDSAFDASVPATLVEDEGTTGDQREPLDDRAIRDAFLRFFCSILGGYERYLVEPDVDFLISGNEWFDAKGFLSSASEEKAAFLGALVSTQLFQSFIQRRTEASDVHCLLFDECMGEFHSSPVPYGRLGGDVETVSSPDSDKPQILYSLLVDQSATEPYLPIAYDKSFDAGSDTDSSSYQMAKGSLSTADMSDKLSITKNPDFAINPTGDWVTVPSRQDLIPGERFIYCIDGNPSFPDTLNKNLYLPKEPESWLVEMSEAAAPLLARSDKEVEEAERRRRQATSHRGLQSQRRCLWQLPKIMGSHFLGSWLLCIPAQVAQSHLSHDQQSKYLLRALGALRLLRSKQRIVPDEAAYRALMVACGRTKNDRRMELVRLFGLLRADGIFPSAVTLGQYTRALAEGYSKRSMGTPDEDSGGGVEVTESASRDLRVGISLKDTADMESALSALDGNLFNLEEAGRRWRKKNNPEKEIGQTGDELSTGQDSKTSTTERQKKRNTHKSWLPVVFSSSFIPTKQDESYSPESPSIASSSIQLLAIWSRTIACDSCGYIPLEEEVQAGWDVLTRENHTPGAIACPRCGSMLIPMLGYKEISVEEALKTSNEPPQAKAHDSEGFADFDTMPPQIGPIVDTMDASYVTYISPASLRLSLERHIAEHGEAALEREHLRAVDPELYYNFWWYCTRFSLPLPLPVAMKEEKKPKHYCTFAAWDHIVAQQSCYDCAKVLNPFLEGGNSSANSTDEQESTEQAESSFEDYPLPRFNLQGFYSSVWDHDDLSEILVTLVEACDKRDFKPVIECLLRCNKRRRDKYGALSMTTASDSDVNSSLSLPAEHGGESRAHLSVELDVYRTILYLAKYQCTTAFHAFFPATLKPCKGYHFWCPIAIPLPILDRLLREAVKRVRAKDNTFAPIYDVSDVALGFRCVFGHLI